MSKGFIKIPRRIYEEKQWNIKRVYSELDAFFDIYASACVRNRTEPDGTKLKQGQLSVSMRILADKWLWNQMKVKRFLQALERKGYLSVMSNKVKTIITIIDYGQEEVLNDVKNSGVTPVTQPVTQVLHDCYTETPTNKGFQEVAVTLPVTLPVTPPVTLYKEYKNINNINNINNTPYNPPKGESSYDWRVIDDNMKPIVEDWLRYKREKKQTYKPTGFKVFCKRLIELSGNDPIKARAITENSMANNWAGIFELKQGARGTTMLPQQALDNSISKYDNAFEGWTK